MDNRNQHLESGWAGKERPVGSSTWDFGPFHDPGDPSLELSAEGVLIVENGIIRHSSPGMAAMSTYSPDEMMDTLAASFFDSDHIAAVELLCQQIRQNQEQPQILEATLVCKNGRRLHTQIIASPCTFKQRAACLLKIRPLGFISAAVDPLLEDCPGLGASLVSRG